MKETARFTAHVTKDAKAVVEDAATYMNDIEVPVETAELVVKELTISEFIVKHWRELLGGSMCWFLLDVAFYSQVNFDMLEYVIQKFICDEI